MTADRDPRPSGRAPHAHRTLAPHTRGTASATPGRTVRRHVCATLSCLSAPSRELPSAPARPPLQADTRRTAPACTSPHFLHLATSSATSAATAAPTGHGACGKPRSMAQGAPSGHSHLPGLTGARPWLCALVPCPVPSSPLSQERLQLPEARDGLCGVCVPLLCHVWTGAQQVSACGPISVMELFMGRKPRGALSSGANRQLPS